MKTIKAHTQDDLRQKVLATPLFQRIAKRRDELVEIIKELKNKGEYVERDLTEELQSCSESLKVTPANGHQSIGRGVFGNKPYTGAGSNYSCIKWTFKGENTYFYTYRIISN